MAFKCVIHVSGSCTGHSSSLRTQPNLHRYRVWLVTRVTHYFQQLLTCHLTHFARTAQRGKRLVSYTRTFLEMTKSLAVHSESKEFDIWRNKEGKERCVIPEGWLLQCCWKLDKQKSWISLAGFRAERKNSHLSKPCQVWSYTTVCLIPKGQRSLPDWCKVIWTSFPSGLAPVISSLQPSLVLISQSRHNQSTLMGFPHNPAAMTTWLDYLRQTHGILCIEGNWGCYLNGSGKCCHIERQWAGDRPLLDHNLERRNKKCQQQKI